MKQQKHPNFIIIGAMKAATTSLYTYLKQHPDVFMTSIKEPMFFNNFQKANNFKVHGRKTKKITTFDQYYSLFNAVKNEKAIGEASPSYIFNEDCPQLIRKYLPETKIIAVLRQPVDRAYSNFLHARRADRESIADFEIAFNKEEERKAENWSPLYYYKGKGYYAKQLERYYRLFPKENIKILLFEDLAKNPIETSQEIFEFLNVDSAFIPDTSRKANVSGVPKGIFGWLIMKLRYYNLIPNIQFSNYLPPFVIQFLFKSAYKKVITSPHVMSDFYKNTPEIILEGLADVCAELKRKNINMEIEAAAEYYIDFDFEQKIGKEKFLTFGDNYILVELSFMQAPNNLFDIIFKLQLEGYKVVLAHPERYEYYVKKDYEELVARGVLLQINLLSLIGYYSPQIQQKTKELITENQVSFVGTDCHNMSHAVLYEKCQTQKDWYDLVNSGKLLNSTL